MSMSLVAFDTDHIKSYVFRTNKLKEIRGASSLLDYLNRIAMTAYADELKVQIVYANGGSGLFLLPNEHAETYVQRVQEQFRQLTGGGATVSYVIEPLLAPFDKIESVDDETDIAPLLKLIQWKLQEKKMQPPATLALPSHPFMRLCDACGIEYAAPHHRERDDERDPDEARQQYCRSCQSKRARDHDVKNLIQRKLANQNIGREDYLWNEVLTRLRGLNYDLTKKTDRPSDFNAFRDFKGSKEYLGVIYADANNMGRTLEKYPSLAKRKEIATRVDKAIYTAVSKAIEKHLQVDRLLKPAEERNTDGEIFPFDILFLGGDDLCIVVPAAVAFDVALTIAKTFGQQMDRQHFLSVGIVLAPVKYPFGFVRELAESTLKFAKKKGADERVRAQKEQAGAVFDDTRINFMIVTGRMSADFSSIYNETYYRRNKGDGQEFYATQRPFTPERLHELLASLREVGGGNGEETRVPNLGRTKLHQLREAVLKMNLHTSVSDGLAVLSNWRQREREYVMRHVYQAALPRSTSDSVGIFPRVTFPWYADGQRTERHKGKEERYHIYRTPLLDFIELYDIVARDGGDASDSQ